MNRHSTLCRSAVLGAVLTASHTAEAACATEICGNAVDDDCDGVVDNCAVSMTSADLTVFGGTVSNHIGFEIAAGDIDADGTADLVAGSEWAALGMGVAYAFMGPATGRTRVTDADLVFRPDAMHGAFGNTVATGDADGDGLTDLVIGAGNATYVFDGPVTASGDGRTADTRFLSGHASIGYAAEVIGDQDGDGLPEIALGAPGGSRWSAGGRVYVASGASTGDVHVETDAEYLYVGGADQDALGARLTGMGDVNGDGIEDLALSAPSFRGTVYVVEGGGSARVFDVSDGMATLSTSTRSSDSFGYAVDAADEDGDGYDDLFVGAPYADNGDGAANGAAYLFHGPLSGSLGSTDADVRWQGATTASFGFAIAAGGDVDGDSEPDTLISAPITVPAAVYLQRGQVSGVVDVSEMISISGEGSDALGTDVAFLPDWSGDGRDEVAIGALWGGADGWGRVYVAFSDRF